MGKVKGLVMRRRETTADVLLGLVSEIERWKLIDKARTDRAVMATRFCIGVGIGEEHFPREELEDDLEYLCRRFPGGFVDPVFSTERGLLVDGAPTRKRLDVLTAEAMNREKLSRSVYRCNLADYDDWMDFALETEGADYYFLEKARKTKCADPLIWDYLRVNWERYKDVDEDVLLGLMGVISSVRDLDVYLKKCEKVEDVHRFVAFLRALKGPRTVDLDDYVEVYGQLNLDRAKLERLEAGAWPMHDMEILSLDPRALRMVSALLEDGNEDVVPGVFDYCCKTEMEVGETADFNNLVRLFIDFVRSGKMSTLNMGQRMKDFEAFAKADGGRMSVLRRKLRTLIEQNRSFEEAMYILQAHKNPKLYAQLQNCATFILFSVRDRNIPPDQIDLIRDYPVAYDEEFRKGQVVINAAGSGLAPTAFQFSAELADDPLAQWTFFRALNGHDSDLRRVKQALKKISPLEVFVEDRYLVADYLEVYAEAIQKGISTEKIDQAYDQTEKQGVGAFRKALLGDGKKTRFALFQERFGLTAPLSRDMANMLQEWGVARSEGKVDLIARILPYVETWDQKKRDHFWSKFFLHGDFLKYGNKKLLTLVKIYCLADIDVSALHFHANRLSLDSLDLILELSLKSDLSLDDLFSWFIYLHEKKISLCYGADFGDFLRGLDPESLRKMTDTTLRFAEVFDWVHTEKWPMVKGYFEFYLKGAQKFDISEFWSFINSESNRPGLGVMSFTRDQVGAEVKGALSVSEEE